MKSYRYRGIEYPCSLVKWVNGIQLKVLSYYETYSHDAGKRIKIKRWITPDRIGKEVYYGSRYHVDYRNGPDGHRPLEHFWPHQQSRKWVKDRLWEKHGDKLVANNINRPLWPVVSDLAKLERAITDMYQDLDAFYAPSECYVDQRRYAEKYRLDILKRHGWGEKVFSRVLKERVCNKWLYLNGYYFT